LACAAGLAAVAASTVPAAAEPLTVLMDQAMLMPIDRPASTVIVGNPSIADATILDNRTLVITGHGYGTTNLLILDADGLQVATEIVSVVPPRGGSVTVRRRMARETFNCMPVCSPVVTIGDNKDEFDVVNGQVRAHRGLAEDAAASGTRD
jgi:Flp pilus assembly secretin CpaC